MISKFLVAAMLTALLASCSSKDSGGEGSTVATTTVSLTSFPVTVEGQLTYEPDDGGDQSGGQPDIFGFLVVGEQEIQVMIPYSVATAAGLAESGDLRVRATLDGEEHIPNLYRVSSVQKL